MSFQSNCVKTMDIMAGKSWLCICDPGRAVALESREDPEHIL